MTSLERQVAAFKRGLQDKLEGQEKNPYHTEMERMRWLEGFSTVNAAFWLLHLAEQERCND